MGNLHPANSSQPRTVGNYHILKRLGHGAGGEVFHGCLATDSTRDFAIKCSKPEGWDRLKTFHPDGASSPKLKFGSIDRELRTMQQCGKHRNIIHVEELVTTEPYYFYLVMEYGAGGDLEHIIAREKSAADGGGLPVERVRRFFSDIVHGVDYMHSRSPEIVHRDLKPANIVLSTEDDRLKICDFGVARFVDENVDVASSKTVVGTPNYAAPEIRRAYYVSRERTEYTKAENIYSIGAILYEMMFGTVYLQDLGPDGDEGGGIKNLIAKKNLDESDPLSVMCFRCLSKEAEARPSAAELREFVDGGFVLVDEAVAVPVPVVVVPTIPTDEIFRQQKTVDDFIDLDHSGREGRTKKFKRRDHEKKGDRHRRSSDGFDDDHRRFSVISSVNTTSFDNGRKKRRNPGRRNRRDRSSSTHHPHPHHRHHSSRKRQHSFDSPSPEPTVELDRKATIVTFFRHESSDYGPSSSSSDENTSVSGDDGDDDDIVVVAKKKDNRGRRKRRRDHRKRTRSSSLSEEDEEEDNESDSDQDSEELHSFVVVRESSWSNGQQKRRRGEEKRRDRRRRKRRNRSPRLSSDDEPEFQVIRMGGRSKRRGGRKRAHRID